MAHPVIYAGSAALGEVFVFGLMQTDRAAEIAAYGGIVQAVVLVIVPVVTAWVAYKVQQAKTASEAAVALAAKNLAETEKVGVAVDGHWKEIERRLTASDEINVALREALYRLTAEKVIADKAVAVNEADEISRAKAVALKELTDLRHDLALATQPPPATSKAGLVESAPLTITGDLPAMVEAAKVIAGAAPQLDKIEKTGEATHDIVTDIKNKPTP